MRWEMIFKGGIVKSWIVADSFYVKDQFIYFAKDDAVIGMALAEELLFIEGSVEEEKEPTDGRTD